MRFIFAIIFTLTSIAIGQPSAFAANTDCTVADCVPRIDTVWAVRNSDLSGDSYKSFYLVSYGSSPTGSVVTPSDGAAGMFLRGGTCLPSKDDGGSILVDASHHCFYRQNLNGDLRQWGVIVGSSFDLIANLSNPSAIADARQTVSNAFSALRAAGKSGPLVVHTNGVSIKIGSTLQIPAGSVLTCDVPPVKRAAKANYTNLPGSIVLSYGAYIDAFTNNDAEVHDCAAILPEWYIDPAKAADFGGYSFNRADDPQFGYADLEKIRANMILAGDFAIKAGEGAKIHDLTIAGFDNCLYLTNAPGFLGKNVSMDCSIGAYLASTNGEMTLKDYDANPYLTKMPGFDNEEYWTVSGVTRDTVTGECKLSLNAVKGQDNGMGGNKPLYSVSDLTESGLNSALGLRADPNYFPAWVTGFKDTTGQPFAMSCLSSGTGKFGNDAAWGVHIISKNPDANNYLNDSATVELMGSRYTSSQATGISVDTTGDWSANTGVIRVTGSISNLTPGMVVTSSDASWPSQQVTVLGIVQRCTGPDEGLVNTNDGYNGCILVSPAPAAANSGSSPALHFFSVIDPPGSIGIPCDGTGQTPCFFYNAAERYVSGNSPAGQRIARLPTSRGGHLGAGFFLDDVAGVRGLNTFSFAHYFNTAVIDAGDCDFVQIKGDENGELNAGNATGIYVSGSSRGCVFLSQGPGQKGASLVVDTFGIVDGASAFASGVDATALHLDTQNVNLSANTSSLLNRQQVHICKSRKMTDNTCDTEDSNEFVLASKVDASTLKVEQRGRFGTAPVNWNMIGGTVYLFATAIDNGSSKHEDKSGTTNFVNLNDPTTTAGNQFEILHGGATFTNVQTGGAGIAFISTNTSGVTITGIGQPNTVLLFEDDNAKLLTSIDAASQFANYVPRRLSTPLIYSNTGPDIPQVLTDANGGALATAYGTGPIFVQDASNWPTTGIALIDNEYVAYDNFGPSGQLTIERRGMCGTTPAAHSQYAVVLNAEAILGCSPNASPILALRNDGALVGSQPLLAHGQVYMSYDGTQYIKLCAQGGGGLIINGILRQVSSKCVTRDKSNVASNSLNYVYAEFHLVGVTNIGSNDAGFLRLTLTDMAGFDNTTPISCALVNKDTGAIVNIADDNDTALSVSNTKIDIDDVQSFNGSNGTCSYVALQFVTPLNGGNHVTGANGVEVRTGHPEQTLVGMLWVGATGVSDSPTKRDVASWFNRQSKTCLTSLTADTGSLSNTSYAEVNGSQLQCEFVNWGPSGLVWLTAGSAVGNASGTIVSTSMGFDNTTAQTEFTEAASTVRLPITVSGNKSGLTEGKHYGTLLCKVSSGSAVYKNGSSLELRIQQ